MPVVVLPDVFNPVLFRTGEALSRFVSGETFSPGTSVLDLGAGSGIVAVTVARRGARVVATDIAEPAVRCVRVNALLNGVEALVDVRQGDLFEPVEGERFDLVLFNPPYYQGAPQEPWEYAWRSDDVLERFIAGLSQVLADRGRALVIVSSDVKGWPQRISGHGLTVRIVWERNLINERLTILELTAAALRPVGVEAQ